MHSVSNIGSGSDAEEIQHTIHTTIADISCISTIEGDGRKAVRVSLPSLTKQNNYGLQTREILHQESVSIKWHKSIIRSKIQR